MIIIMNMASNLPKLMSKNASSMLRTHGIQLHKLRLKTVGQRRTFYQKIMMKLIWILML